MPIWTPKPEHWLINNKHSLSLDINKVLTLSMHTQKSSAQDMCWGGVASVLGWASRQPTLVGHCHWSIYFCWKQKLLATWAIWPRKTENSICWPHCSTHHSHSTRRTAIGNKHPQDSAFWCDHRVAIMYWLERFYITLISQTLIRNCYCCTDDIFSSGFDPKVQWWIWCNKTKYKIFWSKHFSLQQFCWFFKNICSLSNDNRKSVSLSGLRFIPWPHEVTIKLIMYTMYISLYSQLKFSLLQIQPLWTVWIRSPLTSIASKVQIHWSTLFRISHETAWLAMMCSGWRWWKLLWLAGPLFPQQDFFPGNQIMAWIWMLNNGCSGFDSEMA